MQPCCVSEPDRPHNERSISSCSRSELNRAFMLAYALRSSIAVAGSRSMSSSSNESLEAEARLRVREAWCCASHPVPGQHLAVASATSSLCLCVWGGMCCACVRACVLVVLLGWTKICQLHTECTKKLPLQSLTHSRLSTSWQRHRRCKCRIEHDGSLWEP